MNRKLRGVFITLFIISLGLIQTGCGTTQPAKNNQSNQGASMDHGNMNMDHGNMNMSHNSNPANAANNGLQKAFQDELAGLAAIEDDVNKGDYKGAMPLADKLHEEFHALILSPLKAKKGNSYAEEIHGKYDELQDAVKSQDKTKILNLIKVNQNNLHTVANILGVSLKK